MRHRLILVIRLGESSAETGYPHEVEGGRHRIPAPMNLALGPSPRAITPVGRRADKSREVGISSGNQALTRWAFLGIHQIDITQTSGSLFMWMAERIRAGE